MGTTMDSEKKRQLVKLLGPELAAQILATVERTEKAADLAGVRYKERRSAAGPFADVPDFRGNPQTGIGSILRG